MTRVGARVAVGMRVATHKTVLALLTRTRFPPRMLAPSFTQNCIKSPQLICGDLALGEAWLRAALATSQSAKLRCWRSPSARTAGLATGRRPRLGEPKPMRWFLHSLAAKYRLVHAAHAHGMRISCPQNILAWGNPNAPRLLSAIGSVAIGLSGTSDHSIQGKRGKRKFRAPFKCERSSLRRESSGLSTS